MDALTFFILIGIPALAILLAWAMSGWLGLIVLLSQAVLGFLAEGFIVTNLKVPDPLEYAVIVLPSLISLTVWRLAYRRWSLRIDPSDPTAQRMRSYRRTCVLWAIAFGLLHFVVSPEIRHQAEVTVRIRLYDDARLIQEAALHDAMTHGGAYPASLADISHGNPIEGWEIESNGVRRPLTEGLDERTIADEAEFEYFGSGLTVNSQPGIVVVASLAELPDKAHILIANDSQEIWVGPTGFAKIQHLLMQQTPISQWKD